MMDEQQDHVDDLVGAYVLGAVTPEEAATVEAHLATCTQCQRLERELREAEEALPLLAGEMDPPARLKERLMAAVIAEPREAERGDSTADALAAESPDEREAQPPDEREPIPLQPAAPARRADQGMRRYLPLIALAAAVIIVAVGVWRIVGPRPAQPTIRVAMVSAQGQPPIKGQFSYYKNGRRVVLDLPRVKTLPPGRVYELWLVHTNRAGTTITGVTGVTTFRPKANGTAHVEVTGHNAAGYQLAALTVEKGFVTTPTLPIKATSKPFGNA